MIDFKRTNVWGFDGAIYGMRAAHESWDKIDSEYHDCDSCDEESDKKCPIAYPTEACSIANAACYQVGPNDLRLMKSLAKAGNDHGKFLRDIHVQTYITAPLRWWVEMDTYKVATTRLSTSLMHKVMKKGFTEDDFSTDHLITRVAKDAFDHLLITLNSLCEAYVSQLEWEEEKKIPHTKSKEYWYEIQELVPRCFNYGSLMDFNYQTLRTIAHSDRKNHKQDEWREGFFNWMHTLPYAEELIFS